MPEPSNGKDTHEEPVRRRTRHLINRTIFVLGLILMAVGLTGELLGWFNDVGLVLSFTGMAASILALLNDESDDLKENQGSMLDNQAAMLDNQERMLDNHDAMLDNQATMIENQDAMVTQLERIGDLLDERLPGSDA